MRPLRFCMLTTFYPPWSFGGDAVQVRRLSRALADRGHDVTVVHSREAYEVLGGEPPPQPPNGHDGPIRIVSVDAGLGPISPLATYLTGRPALVRRAIERALAPGHDVLHFHNPSLLGGPGLLGMGRGLRLCTLHEQWLVCPTHVLWKYRRRVCERPQCWRCTLVYRRPPQPWRSTGLMDRSVKHLDALIAPSRTTAGLHERFASLVRLEHLGHFLDDPGPRADGREHVGESPFFLYAGRLESIKGVEVVVDAFRRRGERLLVAGTGTEERALRRRARALPNVRFLGWLSEPELDALYRRARAVVVPTRGHESFPLVVLEALARGTPVVAHRFGALAELVDESGGGLTYSDDAELDDALARLAADDALRAELGERGRAAYLRLWTPEAHLRRYFSLIAELARTRGDEELAAAAAAST